MISRTPKSLQMVAEVTNLRDTCSLEEKLWQTNKQRDSVLKSKDIALPTKVHIVKAMVFPRCHVQLWEWTIRKAEHQRIEAFELWCWRRLLRVPWTERRSNWWILKEIKPDYSLKGGLMLKLKLPCFGHLMQRANSLEWTLKLAKMEGKRRRGQQRMNG